MSRAPRPCRPLRPIRRTPAAGWAAVALAVSTTALLLADVQLAIGNHGLATWAVEICATASLALALKTIRRTRHVPAQRHERRDTPSFACALSGEDTNRTLSTTSRPRHASRSRPAHPDTP
jgi:hypothetical protein